MIVGFTGTQRGMSTLQKDALRSALMNLGATELHHGDCIGADAEAAEIARDLGLRLVVHPPVEEAKRAFVSGDEVRAARPYLMRNRHIVAEAEILLAAPSGPERLRSGTWATVRYARQADIPVVIL